MRNGDESVDRHTFEFGRSVDEETVGVCQRYLPAARAALGAIVAESPWPMKGFSDSCTRSWQRTVRAGEPAVLSSRVSA